MDDSASWIWLVQPSCPDWNACMEWTSSTHFWPLRGSAAVCKTAELTAGVRVVHVLMRHPPDSEFWCSLLVSSPDQRIATQLGLFRPRSKNLLMPFFFKRFKWCIFEVALVTNRQDAWLDVSISIRHILLKGKSSTGFYLGDSIEVYCYICTCWWDFSCILLTE